MDAALPLHWESLINTSCRSRQHSYSSSSSSSSSSSREFEFHMQQVQIRPEVVAAAEDAAAGDHHLHVGRDVVQGISHADELFYKGQLLPLHLRPRQQMVEKLTSEYSHTTLERCNPLSTPESSYSSSSSSSSSSACSPTSSYSAAADLVHSHAPDHPAPNKHSTSSSEADSSISSCEIRKSTAAREPAADEEESLRASAACSSAGAAAGESSKTTKEHQQQHRWKKYIKMLKLPAYGKIMMQHQHQQKQQQHIFDLVKIDFKNVAAAAAASEPISSSNPAAAAAASSSSSSSFSRRAGSFNSGQLLLRPVFSQSTISDLQSSLQGAIAHCKQSHCAHI
ncbi:unnamed protein product [Sphagnum compactum]